GLVVASQTKAGLVGAYATTVLVRPTAVTTALPVLASVIANTSFSVSVFGGMVSPFVDHDEPSYIQAVPGLPEAVLVPTAHTCVASVPLTAARVFEPVRGVPEFQLVPLKNQTVPRL